MATTLSTLVVRMAADIAQFQSDMGKAVHIAQRTSAQIERAFSALKSVAGAALSAFTVREILDRTIDAERTLNRLNTVLQTTGHAAGISAEQIDQLVESLKRSTAFDDDEIRKGISSLLRFREVQGDMFKEAAKLAPDLAAALDIGLVEAYQRLGRALQDPVVGMKGLRDAGVKLNEQQLENIRRLSDFGNKAAAQKLVLDELAKSIGGAAAGENVGLYGASKSLGKAWDDMLKEIGKSDLFTSIAHAGLNLLRRDLEVIKNLAESDAVRGAMGRDAVKGKITGAPISPKDFGGMTELEFRLQGLNQLIRIAQNQPKIDKKISEGEQLIRQLEEQLAKVGELTVAEQMLALVQTQRYSGEKKALKDRAVGRATEIDLKKSLALYEKNQRDAEQAAEDASNAFAQAEVKRLATLRQTYASLIDPVAKYRKQFEEIAELRAKFPWMGGTLDQAELEVQKQWREELERVKGETNKIIDGARELGLTFSSAFEDAIVGGKSFRDILGGIEKDLLRIGTRKLVTEPLADWATGLLKSISGGLGGATAFPGWIGQIGNWLSGTQAPAPVVDLSFATGTDFVPRDMLAMVHKGEAIIPASENRAGAQSIVMNIYTPDANSFRASRGQIAAEISSAISVASRRNN